jgi:putative holliday junction resolvase
MPLLPRCARRLKRRWEAKGFVRYLGVDFGSARTGLSLSDTTGLICRPLTVVVERDIEALIDRVLEYACREDVGEIVVGLPRPLSGGTNAQLEAADAFAGRLRERASMAVATWDERFTSKLAESGRSPRTPADAVAACYVLQNYLDAVHLKFERDQRSG